MTFVTCDDKLTWEALVKLLVQVSSDGCTAANTIQSVACEEEPVATNFRLRPDGSKRKRPDNSNMLRP